MSKVTLRTRGALEPLWGRPTLEIDRWLKEGVFEGFTPAAEIVKDGEDAVVRLELPGVDVAKDVNVEVDRGHLVIHGERRDEHADEDPAKDGRTLREVRYGSFRRSFKLPAHVACDDRSRRPTTRACSRYGWPVPTRVPKHSASRSRSR